MAFTVKLEIGIINTGEAVLRNTHANRTLVNKSKKYNYFEGVAVLKTTH